MGDSRLSLSSILIKTVVVHTVTYFVMGILAFTLFDYTTAFAQPNVASFMRQTDDPLVMAGVLFQPIRGLLFGVVFYLLRQELLARERGWLMMWLMLVIVGILSTFGPAPGSIEGMIYTKWPISSQLTGYLEVVTQALLLSVILYYWVNNPGKRWLNWVLGIAFVLVLALPALGLILAPLAT